MMHKRVLSFTKATAIAVLAGLPSVTLAAGFQLTEQSVSGLGRAFAGGSAWAVDGSTVFYNPAGLTELNSSELLMGASIISLGADFDRTVAEDAFGQPLTGGEGGDIGKLGGVPIAYYVRPINEKMVFGFGINAPFGLSTDHPTDWIGRYQAVYSNVSTLNLNPSIGYVVNENFSVGFGLDIQHMRVKLTNMVDYGTICYARVDPITCNALGMSPQNNDGLAVVEGDSGWSNIGFNLGFLAKVGTGRIGFHYRSGIDHDLEGDANFNDAPAVFQTQGLFVDTGISAEFTTPESISLSWVQPIDDKWTFSADYTYTGWDSFEELRIVYDNAAQPDTVQPENWTNVSRFAVGADYKYNETWTFRAGIAVDRSPVEDEFRTPRLPDADRNWLSFGASWKIDDAMEMNFGYAHLFLDDRIPLDETGATGDHIAGTYKASADIFGVEMRMKF